MPLHMEIVDRLHRQGGNMYPVLLVKVVNENDDKTAPTDRDILELIRHRVAIAYWQSKNDKSNEDAFQKVMIGLISTIENMQHYPDIILKDELEILSKRAAKMYWGGK